MMKNISLLLAALIIVCSCNEGTPANIATDKESYEKTKQSLLGKETKQPQNFLHVTGYDKHNLIGQTVVKGSIINKASVAIYKDVDLQLDFYSKTGALLESDKETVYETLHPGEIKNFKTKYFAPKGSDSVALRVLNAKTVE